MDFYFFIGSTYSYLSVMRAERAAAQAGVVLVWRPFSVRTLMREQNNTPFAAPVKKRYMWRDVERRAAQHGLSFNGAPPHPVDADERANRVATLAASEGWCREFTQAAYRAWFLDGQDPGAPETLRQVLQALGRDAAQCLAEADREPTRQAYLASTDEARSLGIFGSPTFVVDREIFWGDDRLDDALAWATARAP